MRRCIIRPISASCRFVARKKTNGGDRERSLIRVDCSITLEPETMGFPPPKGEGDEEEESAPPSPQGKIHAARGEYGKTRGTDSPPFSVRASAGEIKTMSRGEEPRDKKIN